MKMKIREFEKIGQLEIERKTLINEITKFCIKYEVFKEKVETSDIEMGVEAGLESSAFIESLINIIILKTKYSENMDIEKVKFILLELEKIRLDLE